MKRGRWSSIVALLALASCVSAASPTLPDFEQPEASLWVNSKPLTLADLKGKVVFLHVWTFG